jgi:cap1 methyltransferase
MFKNNFLIYYNNAFIMDFLNDKINNNYIYCLQPKDNKIKLRDENIYYKLNKNCYEKLINYKDKIKPYFESKLWDTLKKFTNDYEFIYSTHTKISINNTYKIYNSIVNINPISRSYFKLWEILTDMNEEIGSIFKKDNFIYSAHIAEGPGGFIESFVNFVNKNYDICDKYIYGITLLSKNNKIPKWKFKKNYLIENNINLNHYKENSGNLYDINIIDYFIKKIGCNKCNFCTADGGFDFSSNYNSQEENFILFLISEIYLTLNLLKNNGNCVIKIYDIFNNKTIKILNIIYNLFDKIFFIKPYTSRPANSEKYLFCYNYNSIKSKNILNNLREIIINKNINLLNENISYDFLDIIFNYNIIYIKKQINSIENTLDFIEQYELFKKNNDIIQAENLLDNKYQNNLKKIIKWCINYNINYLTVE